MESASVRGQKSTHTASVADGMCLRAVRGTAHMHPERHSKGMKEQAMNRATSCRRLKGDYAFPDRRPKLGRQCTPLCMPSQRISESSSRESGPAITCSSQSATRLNHSQSDNETFDRARGKKQLGSCFRKPSINRRSALHAEQCAACNALFAHTTRAHPPPRTAPPEACGTANRW